MPQPQPVTIVTTTTNHQPNYEPAPGVSHGYSEPTHPVKLYPAADQPPGKTN